MRSASLAARFGKKKKTNEEMALQITSMADIFTIILVFLLKSFSTDAVNVAPGQGVSLPVSREGAPLVETLKVEVSPSAVQIDGREVAHLTSFLLDASDMESTGASKQLTGAFAEERAKGAKTDKPDARLTVIADQRTPYSTLKAVLASASVQGYSDFKLVVINPEN